MELVDLILITKADGQLLPEVRRIHSEWSSALRLMRRRSANWTPKVRFSNEQENISHQIFPRTGDTICLLFFLLVKSRES